jgi:CRISPR system Cascade subunit CasB
MSTEERTQVTEPAVERRREYVKYLYGVAGGLRSSNQSLVAESRRILAGLRHSLGEGRQLQAYTTVFRHNPPHDEAEQETWLLVGGLFALHPLVWRVDAGPRSLGASLGKLDKKLKNSPSVARRFTQILARDKRTLPHHLRQVIRLLAAHDIPVHYGQLLDDLVVLLGNDYRGDRASRVRLKWAREYHMPIPAEPAEENETSELQETTQ